MEFGMKDAIAKAAEGKDLTQEEAKAVMNIMLSGEATQAQLGAILTALRTKGRNPRGVDWIRIRASGKGGHHISEG